MRAAGNGIGRWVVAAGAAAILVGPALTAGPAGLAIPRARPAIEGNRAPLDLVFAADGKRAFVSELAEGTVAVVDTASRTVVSRYDTGGDRPAGLAITTTGKLIVANSYSGTVAVLDAATGERTALIPVPGLPYGVAAAPDGRRAYVSVSQLDEVAVIDLATNQVAGRVKVGRRPRALDLTPDGKTLAVANLAGGTVSVVNTETLQEEAQVRLKGVNVRGIAVTADGSEAYTTVMPPFNGKPTTDPQEIWHNIVQAVSLNGTGSGVGEDQWMDFARLPGSADVVGTPDQYDVVLDRKATRAWVAVGGRDVLTRITIHDRRRDAIWPISQLETVVGANPRGLCLTPDAKQVWVANHLGNSLTAVDADTMKVVGTVELGAPTQVDPTVGGQYLFNNASLTRGHRFTCASCHPDGTSDGLVWSFVHVKDGVDRRNSRDLRAGVADTAPFRWSGVDAHLAEFVESEVTGLLYGPKPSAEQVSALEKAVGALRLPPNPYRQPDGELSEAAKEGQSLFTGKAGCSTCHAGPKQGSTGMKGWVGTTREGSTLDVPHLRGVHDSAPYLHHGRAATLEDVFEKFNEGQRHGAYHELTAEERKKLLRYLREL